jgi:glycosyltransferase involved in cell wall biosynthesis
MKPLLTIAIPTYNRAGYLDLNLRQIGSQIEPHKDAVEIIVSDNCSSDNTAEVVAQHQGDDLPISYIRNEQNLGADSNFIQCFNQANGTYLLILGDDDLLVDGALADIVDYLKSGNFGVVRLCTYGYENDFRAERPKKTRHDSRSSSAESFIAQFSYFIGFVSGAIVNKELVEQVPGFKADRFADSNFPHLYWFLTAAIKAPVNGTLSRYTVAAKRNNSGNYKLFEIFAQKLNTVFDWFVVNENVSPRLFLRINNELLTTFFPYFILRTRAGLNTSFPHEDCFSVLRATHGSNPRYWLLNAPLAFIPRFLCLWLLQLGDFLHRRMSS